MKTTLIAAAALVASLLPAYAADNIDEIDKRSDRIFATEGVRKESLDRVVVSGTKTRVGFYSALNPDCTLQGDTVVRVTTQPEHGTVEVAPFNWFVGYKKDNSRAKCNDHKVKGQAVQYKSEDKYAGDDAFDVLVIFPTGFAWELHYNLKVK